MACFQIFFIPTFFFFLFFFLPNTESSAPICEPAFCSRFFGTIISIKFPFQLNTSFQSKRCGYPGFNLSCNNQFKTILSLPYSGDFVVDYINYVSQSITIKDPDDDCPPRWFLNQNISLLTLGSPFQLDTTETNTYFYYNCSSNVTGPELYSRILCLSDDNFTVIATPGPNTTLQRLCQLILITPYVDSVQLSGREPNCFDCQYEICALKNDTSLEVGCFDYYLTPTTTPTTGLSRSAKYGIAFGMGILGILCVITYLTSGKQSNQVQSNTQLSTSIVPRQTTLVMGLDEPTIESYPLTLLGESLRLPKPTKDTCSICLSKYQPNETLRTIPKCCHYFHANCIDEWLKINVACPICRNSPD